MKDKLGVSRTQIAADGLLMEYWHSPCGSAAITPVERSGGEHQVEASMEALDSRCKRPE